jgi:hypothetical protein
MDSIPLVHSTKVRCAPFHLATGADPVGSAGRYDAFLCVEVPLPWGRDISEHEPFASLGAGGSVVGADGRSWRPQGLVPGEETSGGVRVVAYEQPSTRGPSQSYQRREWSVPDADVAALCSALVSGDEGAQARFDDRSVAVAADVVDLLVCTHGRRDVCCGGSGTVLHDEVAERLAGDAGVRVFRVSHTGGHRFAPTALTFPDGYAWAHLDADVATSLVQRRGAVDAAMQRCRGLASASSVAAQVADRELFARLGWTWVDAARSFRATEPTGASQRSDVRVDALWPDGSALAAIVQVEMDREIPQPTCGDLEGGPAPTAPVWRATRVDRLEVQ